MEDTIKTRRELQSQQVTVFVFFDESWRRLGDMTEDGAIEHQSKSTLPCHYLAFPARINIGEVNDLSCAV